MQFLTAAELIKRNFSQELHDASEGKNTSLRFIKHQLTSEKIVKDGEIFQVLVVGGTVFKKALVKKENGEILILEEHSEEHPALSSKEMFLEFIANQIYPKSNIISINFAFPLGPILRHGRMDGILIKDTKENVFTGLLNQPFGELLENYLLKTQNIVFEINIVNDVICLWLSKPQENADENTAGAVIGTGTNISFFYNDFPINIESGNFNNFTPSPECMKADEESSQPGSALFEKEIAGEYLYKQFNYLLKKNSLKYLPIISTKELYEITKESQNVEIKAIAQALFEKSAAYFAGQIAGLAAFKNSPLTVIMEGSLYWDNPLYQKYFREYLNKLSQDLDVKIVKIENSSIVGAANLIA